jgi:hypothetical protein
MMKRNLLLNYKYAGYVFVSICCKYQVLNMDVKFYSCYARDVVTFRQKRVFCMEIG